MVENDRREDPSGKAKAGSASEQVPPKLFETTYKGPGPSMLARNSILDTPPQHNGNGADGILGPGRGGEDLDACSRPSFTGMQPRNRPPGQNGLIYSNGNSAVIGGARRASSLVDLGVAQRRQSLSGLGLDPPELNLSGDDRHHAKKEEFFKARPVEATLDAPSAVASKPDGRVSGGRGNSVQFNDSKPATSARERASEPQWLRRMSEAADGGLVLRSLQHGFAIDTRSKLAWLLSCIALLQVLHLLAVSEAADHSFMDGLLGGLDSTQGKYHGEHGAELTPSEVRRLELYVQASLWTDITGVFVAVAMLVTLAVKRACPCILFYAPFPMLLLYACVLCSMVFSVLDPAHHEHGVSWAHSIAAAGFTSVSWALLVNGSTSPLARATRGIGVAGGVVAVAATGAVEGHKGWWYTTALGIVLFLVLVLSFWVLHSTVLRVRETLGDDVAMLRLLQSAMWVLLPACSAVVAWRMSRPMWGIGMAEEARLSGEVGVYLALVVLVFLTLSVGTRLSRVLSEQRDAMLADMMPKDVAKALIMDFSKQQAHGNRRASRYSSAGGADRAEIDAVMELPPRRKSIGGTRRMTLSTPAGQLTPQVMGRTANTTHESEGVPSSHVGRRSFFGKTSSFRKQGRVRPSPHASSNQLMATDNGDNIVEKRTNSVVHNNVFCSAPCAPTGDLMFFKEHPEVGILYSDLVGWTTLSSKIEPKTAFRALHTVFSMLDCVTDSLGLYKYETVGDAYITASNLTTKKETHCETTLAMAVTLCHVVRTVSVLAGLETVQLQARVGVHRGPVAAGVVGLKRKLMCLVGDTMNVGARMETTSKPSHVHASEAFWTGLPEHLQKLFVEQETQVKGKGVMKTFLLDVDKHDAVLSELGFNLLVDEAKWAEILAT